MTYQTKGRRSLQDELSEFSGALGPGAIALGVVAGVAAGGGIAYAVLSTAEGKPRKKLEPKEPSDGEEDGKADDKADPADKLPTDPPKVELPKPTPSLPVRVPPRAIPNPAKPISKPVPDAPAGKPIRQPEERVSTPEPVSGDVLTDWGVAVDIDAQSVVIRNLTTWVEHAAARLRELDLERWTAEALFDRVWFVSFPSMGDRMSTGDWVVEGKPYDELVELGQRFLDRWRSEPFPARFPVHEALAQLMGGETGVEPPRVDYPIRQDEYYLTETRAGLGTFYVTLVSDYREMMGGPPKRFWWWRVYGPGEAVLRKDNALREATRWKELMEAWHEATEAVKTFGQVKDAPKET